MSGNKRVGVVVGGGLLVVLMCGLGLVDRETPPYHTSVSSEDISTPLPLKEVDALAARPTPEVKQPVFAPSGAERLNESGGVVIDSPWQSVEIDADFPLAEPGEAVEQPLAIVLQGDALGHAQVGDSVTLPLPDGSTVEARVTKVILQQGGRRNWQGEIQVDGGSFPVNFTLGGQATFGFIGTPQGSYSVETMGGKGWVYKNPPLDLGHGGSDALTPTHQ